ncbi:MAG: PorT family protein [Muribaculaceae bacterium]|nr:PorT family protein [Muribaculaceae bacterium]
MKQHFIHLAIIVATLFTALTAHAQIRYGIKGGVIANKLHFNKDFTAKGNQIGFTGGLQIEISMPITGLGLEGALMYAHRNDALTSVDKTYKRDYLEIPVHIKYGINLLGFNKILVPYAFTGPNFSFLFNETEQSSWDNRASNTSWDVGFGVELVNHLQVQAAYGIGLTKSFKQIGITDAGEPIEGRDHCWTVTAAYLF